MSRPKPKFCVGEEVRITGCRDPSYNTEHDEILKVEWVDEWKNGMLPPCWAYVTTNIAHKGNLSHPEHRLRKIPPEERTGWEECVWQPNKETIKE